VKLIVPDCRTESQRRQQFREMRQMIYEHIRFPRARLRLRFSRPSTASRPMRGR
jgi:hypothetical protein